MSEGISPARFERILVTCDPTLPGCTALQAAAALAASFQAELAGLFVEDVNLLRMAALPFTRELGLASAVVRPIDVPDIEREFRLHASRVRRALEDAAAASSLRWSFQVVRGQPLAAALSARRDADLLVVGEATPSAARGARGMMPGRTSAPAAAPRPRRGARTHPVAVVYDGSVRAERALAVAAALAKQINYPLAVWVVADDEGHFKTMREQVRAAISGQDGAVRITWLHARDLRRVADAIGAEAPAALLWHDPLDSQQLAILLAVLHCPLVLLT